MKNIRSKIAKYFKIYSSTINFEGNSEDYIDKEDFEKAMLNFAHEMCEEQKKECANEQEGTIEAEYCLNCKNVCDENL